MKLPVFAIATVCVSLQLQTSVAHQSQNALYLRGAQTNIREITQDEKSESRLLHKTKKSKKGKKDSKDSKGSTDNDSFIEKVLPQLAPIEKIKNNQVEESNQDNENGEGSDVDTNTEEAIMGSPPFIDFPNGNTETAPANPDDFDDKYKTCVTGLFHVLVVDTESQEITLDYYLNVHNGHCIVINKRCPSFYEDDLVTYSSCADECLLPGAENPC